MSLAGGRTEIPMDPLGEGTLAAYQPIGEGSTGDPQVILADAATAINAAERQLEAARATVIPPRSAAPIALGSLRAMLGQLQGTLVAQSLGPDELARIMWLTGEVSGLAAEVETELAALGGTPPTETTNVADDAHMPPHSGDQVADTVGGLLRLGHGVARRRAEAWLVSAFGDRPPLGLEAEAVMLLQLVQAEGGAAV